MSIRGTTSRYVVGRRRYVGVQSRLVLVACVCVLGVGEPGYEIGGDSNEGRLSVGGGEGENVVGRGDSDAAQCFIVGDVVVGHDLQSRELPGRWRLRPLARWLRWGVLRLRLLPPLLLCALTSLTAIGLLACALLLLRLAGGRYGWRRRLAIGRD